MPNEAKTRRTTGDQQELSAAVSERVQILEVRLLETRAEQKPFEHEALGRVTTNIHVESHTDMAASQLEVFPHFMLVVQRDNASPEEVFVRIEARFAVRYALSSLEGLTQRNYDAFGRRNAVYNVWPYWREFVQSMTGRMGLPPLTLPVFRLGVSKIQAKVSALPRVGTKQIEATEPETKSKRASE